MNATYKVGVRRNKLQRTATNFVKQSASIFTKHFVRITESLITCYEAVQR